MNLRYYINNDNNINNEKFIRDTTTTWLTKEKVEILICEMSTIHIVNCINLLKRKNSSNNIINTKIKILKNELKYRKINNILMD